MIEVESKIRALVQRLRDFDSAIGALETLAETQLENRIQKARCSRMPGQRETGTHGQTPSARAA